MPEETTVIGNVITNPPRAVLVRSDPAHPKEAHSAVVANVTILTENRLETQAILDNWAQVADAINEVVLRLVTPVEPKGDVPDAFTGFKGNHPLADG